MKKKKTEQEKNLDWADKTKKKSKKNKCQHKLRAVHIIARGRSNLKRGKERKRKHQKYASFSL